MLVRLRAVSHHSLVPPNYCWLMTVAVFPSRYFYATFRISHSKKKNAGGKHQMWIKISKLQIKTVCTQLRRIIFYSIRRLRWKHICWMNSSTRIKKMSWLCINKSSDWRLGSEKNREKREREHFPWKWLFCSLEHMGWKRCETVSFANVLCDWCSNFKHNLNILLGWKHS